MLLTNKAIWTIERNFGRPLTLAEIAATCQVSPFHLSHAFADATGQSVMAYVRGRRLSAAAEALANGASDILALALDHGYGSHEAFSRAFRAQFGTTPESVRRDGLGGITLVPALKMLEEAPADITSARYEEPGDMAFAGLIAHYSFGAIQDIPAQWQRFMADYAEIFGKAAGIPVGVTLGFEVEGEFDYLCAAQIAHGARFPSRMTRVNVPAQRYAVFQHRGHVASISSTYSAIWNHWLPASGQSVVEAPILERHHPTFNTETGFGGLEIWLPIAA